MLLKRKIFISENNKLIKKVIKIEKEFSYGIIAIVSIVGLFVLFNSGIVKIGGGELSGQATLLKNERNVDCLDGRASCRERV